MLLFSSLLMWMPQSPHREFIFAQNPISSSDPKFQFFDVDGSRIKCFWNQSTRAGTRYPTYLEFTDDPQSVIQATLTDINIDTETPAFKLRLTERELVLSQAMPSGVLSFQNQEMVVYHQGKQLSQEDVQKYLAMGAITVSPFTKSKRQSFTDPPLTLIDEEELEEKRVELKVPQNYESLPRTFYFRREAKDKFQIKRRVLDASNSSQFVTLGKFAEGKCLIGGEEQHGLIMGTCLPVKSEKDKCELLDVEIKPNGCGHVIKLGCTRLCRIKNLAQTAYDTLDSELIMCSKM
ncbi:Conserved_hypothetical protein [Hexamita inflata]|uniref:Uncharacterized protein n=1 Tax=Hexamita inflata TaxID=28002 RepID=A0AA86V3F2_9EUKA|nr:Conserved hypothetical protein [Hexamita inflata]